MELSGTTTFQDFDGYGKANRLGDHMLSLTAGFSFHIGKVGWKRAIDPSPISAAIGSSSIISMYCRNRTAATRDSMTRIAGRWPS